MGGEQRQGGTETRGLGGQRPRGTPGGVEIQSRGTDPERRGGRQRSRERWGQRPRERGNRDSERRGQGLGGKTETQREGGTGMRGDRDRAGEKRPRERGGTETQERGTETQREEDRDPEREGDRDSGWGARDSEGGQRPRERRPEVWGWGVERAQRKRAKGGVGTETWKAKTQREKWGQRPRDGRG